MAIPIEEIFGLDLLAPERQPEVVAMLRSLPLPPEERARLYARWLRAVGIQPTAEELAIVIRIGWPGAGRG